MNLVGVISILNNQTSSHINNLIEISSALKYFSVFIHLNYFLFNIKSQRLTFPDWFKKEGKMFDVSCVFSCKEYANQCLGVILTISIEYNNFLHFVCIQIEELQLG